MPTTVPHPGVAGTSLQGRTEAAAEGGWRGNTQAGAEWRGGGIIYSRQQIPRWTCLLLPPLCCLHLENPALLQPFSLLKSRLSHTGVQAGGKPKGGAYLPARQLQGVGMLSAPTSHLLHLYPSLCLHISDSESQEHLSMGLVGSGAPGRVWWSHTSWPVLSKTVFISAPAASASFLPVLLHFRHPARLCPVSRKRREGCA